MRAARRTVQHSTDKRRGRGILPPAPSAPAEPGSAGREPEEAGDVRADGRRADELRLLEIEVDYLEQPAGSALISAGKTRVLCTASIPRACRAG